MTEAFVVGGVLVLGLVIAAIYEAIRRRKKTDDNGPGPTRPGG